MKLKHLFFVILSILMSGCGNNNSTNELEKLTQERVSTEKSSDEVLQIPSKPKTEIAQAEKLKNELADLIHKHEMDKQMYELALEVITENEKVAQNLAKDTLNEADRISLKGMQAQVKANLPLKDLIKEILTTLKIVDDQIQKINYKQIIIDLMSPIETNRSSAFKTISEFFKEENTLLSGTMVKLSLLKEKHSELLINTEKEKAKIRTITTAELDKLPKSLDIVDPDKVETFRNNLADLINNNNRDKTAFRLELEDIEALEKSTTDLKKIQLNEASAITLNGIEKQIKANLPLKDLLIKILDALDEVDNQIQKASYKNIYVDLTSPKKEAKQSASNKILDFFQVKNTSLSNARQKFSSLKDELSVLRQKIKEAKENIQAETIAKLDKLSESSN